METQDKQPTNTLTSVQDRVLGQIIQDAIEPRPRYVFLCLTASVWGLWLLSIVFGALAAAVVFCTTLYRYYDLYEVFNPTFIAFSFEVLPFVWIGLFALMIYVAYRQLRKTATGYRYPTAWLAISSLVLSGLIGYWAHSYGFGWWLDTKLDGYASAYPSQSDLELKMWQEPELGRLVGSAGTEVVSDTIHIQFTDMNGQVWDMDITELALTDRALLDAQSQVRVLGELITAQPAVFHACNVFPWTMGQAYTKADIKERRAEYINKIYDHKDKYLARLAEFEEAVADDQGMDKPAMSPCADMTAVERVSESM